MNSSGGDVSVVKSGSASKEKTVVMEIGGLKVAVSENSEKKENAVNDGVSVHLKPSLVVLF